MWNTTDSARHQKFVTDYRTTLRTNMTTAADYATDVTIGDYGLIGDARGAALVSKSGSVDWLCWPRFDSPSLFAALLDRRVGGHWKISVEGAHEIKREYLGQSNVLCRTTRRARAPYAFPPALLDCVGPAGEPV